MLLSGAIFREKILCLTFFSSLVGNERRRRQRSRLQWFLPHDGFVAVTMPKSRSCFLRYSPWRGESMLETGNRLYHAAQADDRALHLRHAGIR